MVNDGSWLLSAAATNDHPLWSKLTRLTVDHRHAVVVLGRLIPSSFVELPWHTTQLSPALPQLSLIIHDLCTLMQSGTIRWYTRSSHGLVNILEPPGWVLKVLDFQLQWLAYLETPRDKTAVTSLYCTLLAPSFWVSQNFTPLRNLG